MPKENKKRGRRAEAQKRKLDEAGEEEEAGSDVDQLQKRQKLLDTPPEDNGPIKPADSEMQGTSYTGLEGGNDVFFYGLLDEEDAEYFRRADNMLEANQFATPDERTLFLANVHKEANGKELKMACSQSCSRLFERLILLSTPAQLKDIFQKFSGHFLNLVQHRFASHCCETLFLQSAPAVTRELLAGSAVDAASAQDDSQQVFVSMENLFLYAINEFTGNIGFLLTDRFASHTLRVLLLVLSGQPLDDPAQATLVKSRKKENIEVVDIAHQADEPSHASLRVVPESFSTSLDSLIKESIGGLDSSYLRALATHPIGNPALQSLLRLDLTHFGKTRAKDATSILQKLLPLDSLAEGSEGAAFVNGLMYDPIGSRLLETIVEFAPGKTFKALYRDFFRERIGSLARNEISAYIVIKLLGRLSADDLQDAMTGILPQFSSLIERGRTAVIRTLAERCVARGVDAKPVATALQSACSEDGGVTFSLLRLLRIPTDPPDTTNDAITPPDSQDATSPPLPTPTASTSIPTTHPAHAPTNPSITLHASLLAQSLLKLPSPPLHTLVFDSLTYLQPPLFHTLAIHPSTSHLLQAALASPYATLISRRKLISRFYGRVAQLATHPAGSHLVDAIWAGTVGLGFMRERIAEELAENESALRESNIGRKVWRNWRMDVYKRRPSEWMREMRREAGNDGFLSFPLDGDCERKEARHEQKSRGRGPNGGTPPGAAGGKTSLQLARERFAKSHALRKEAKTVEG